MVNSEELCINDLCTQEFSVLEFKLYLNHLLDVTGKDYLKINIDGVDKLFLIKEYEHKKISHISIVASFDEFIEYIKANEAFKSRNRKLKNVFYRQAAMYILRIFYNRSYTKIAHTLGYDHSTAIYAVKASKNMLETNHNDFLDTYKGLLMFATSKNLLPNLVKINDTVQGNNGEV